MKIAAYAISKNVKSSVDAVMDGIDALGLPLYVLDHSTDGTTEKLRRRGAIVNTKPIVPWSFAAGKNFALGMIPDAFEWALNIDMDERICVPEMQRLFKQIDPDASRIYHLYQPDHEQDRVREESRIHRPCYEWVFPIHECLISSCVKSWPYQNWGCATATEEKIQMIDECILTQHPDRERKHTWCDMLLRAVKEYPLSPRMRMLCGRDLYFDSRYDDAMEQFSRFIELKNTSRFELSYVMTMAARCQRKLGRPDLELVWLQSAAQVCKRRESWVELAHAYLVRGKYEQAQDVALSAIDCTECPYAAHSEPGAWTFKPHEIAMLAAYHLDDLDSAVALGEQALLAATGDDAKRISGNLLTYREKRSEMEELVV